MRAFYYLLKYLFNNLLSIHIHKCGEKLGEGGGLTPQAPDERRLWWLRHCEKNLNDHV